MKKTSQTIFALSIICAFALSLFVNINFSHQTEISFTNKAEAGWLKDLEHDLSNERRKQARSTRRDILRDIRKDVNDFRKEQRNIRRADGDPRFADRYLSDGQVKALRILKSLPVGQEVVLELMSSEANNIRTMCRRLPEFSFVRNQYDSYGEKIGIVVYRRSAEF